MKSPKEIVELMFSNDLYSRFLGVSIESCSHGTCQLKLKVHEQLLNGFKIAHGGISYALADSALAFAANTYGFKAVSIESSISHLKTVDLGDELIATAVEINKGNKLGVYQVTVLNQNNLLVAHFKGTVFFSQDHW